MMFECVAENAQIRGFQDGSGIDTESAFVKAMRLDEKSIGEQDS